MQAPTVLPGMFGEFVFTPKVNTDYFMTDVVLTAEQVLYTECTDLIGLYPVGVLIKYPCGTKRFIKDKSLQQVYNETFTTYNPWKDVRQKTE